MSVRFPSIGWLLVGLTACSTAIDSPVAPESSRPNVPVQAGPPPTGNNNAPTVAITAPTNGASVVVGSTVQLSADLTDADVADTHTCWVDWQLTAGPGVVVESGGTGTCTASNVYSNPGQFQVVVAVIDPAGATAVDTVGITVAVGTPPPPPPPPSPTPQLGSVRGEGRIPLRPGTLGRGAGTEGAVFFELAGRQSKETNSPRGEAAVDIPRANFRMISTALTRVDVRGNRADVTGTGMVNRRRPVFFVICTIDGDRAGANGSDRIRIKIWGQDGVLFDTDPGLPMSADPTVVPKPGRIVIKP